MTEQLALIPQAPKLTERQAQALQIIEERQPILSGDLGQALGVHPDYQTTNGHAIAHALRRKGLVRYSRKHEGWTLVKWKPVDNRIGPGEVPDGF